ncbi:hypothetical protein GW17_00027117 [Ensete ventricosum]|nr:hypothetical protein GW17_00027117 [Ensete ventricosum]
MLANHRNALMHATSLDGSVTRGLSRDRKKRSPCFLETELACHNPRVQSSRRPLGSDDQMTKQNVVMQEELAVAVPTAAAIAEPSPCFSYPPPRAVGSGTNYTRYTKLSCRLDLASCGGRAANSWIESMKALSPTQAKSAGQREVPSLASREEEDYDSWQVSVRFCLILLWLLNKHLRIRTQMLHPSALDNFEEVMTASKGKQIVMFLDYDGTLSPIVDDPDRAFMSDEVSFSDYVPLLHLLFILSLPSSPLWNGGIKELHVLKQMREAVREVASHFPTAIVIETTKSIPGSRVENNKFCLSVHFRCVDEKVLKFLRRLEEWKQSSKDGEAQ